MGMLLYMMEMQNNSNSKNINTNAEGAAKEKEVAPKASPQKTDSEFTEEKIKKMNGSQLRKLAEKNGIKNPEELTAGELKAVLCEMLVK